MGYYGNGIQFAPLLNVSDPSLYSSSKFSILIAESSQTFTEVNEDIQSASIPSISNPIPRMDMFDALLDKWSEDMGHFRIARLSALLGKNYINQYYS